MYGDLMSMDNFTNSVSRDIFDQFKAYPVAFFTDSKEGKDNYFTDMDRCNRMMEENFVPQIALELILPNIELERS